VKGTVSGGTASAIFTLPAGQAAGSYTIAVSYSDSTSQFIDSGDTNAALTVKRAPLTVTAVGINKPYDGTTTATVTLSDNHLGSYQVTKSYTSASFANTGPGNNIAVTVSGISISGASAGNYSLQNTTATTTANITLPLVPVSTYDAQGRLIEIVYPNGNVYKRTYASDGSSTATLTNSSGTVSSGVTSDAYTYNAQGKLTSAIAYYTNGNVFTRTYASDGSSTATLKNSSGVLLDDYSYNAQGAVTAYDVYYSNGNVYRRVYASNGSSTATLKNSSGVLLDDYTYNAQSVLTAYDVYYSNGNVFHRTYASDGSSTATLKNSGGVLLNDYSYNAQGTLTAYDTYYSNGNVFHRVYATDGSSTATLTNNSGTVASGVKSVSYTYNAQSVVTAYDYHYTNGNVFTRTYDSDGDGTSYATLTNSSGTILDYYEYDANGKLIYGPSPIKPSPWPPK
jgi:YD repeat-containing protein